MGITMKIGSAGMDDYERFNIGRMKIGTESPIEEVSEPIIDDTEIKEVITEPESEVKEEVIAPEIEEKKEEAPVEETEQSLPKKAGRPKKTE